RVEPNLRVGQVKVIDEQQVGQVLAVEILYRGILLGDVELDATTQLHATGLAVVKTDREPVRPDRREFGRCLLLDAQGTDRLALRGGQRPQRIEAGRFQPQLRPGPQVAAGPRFDVGEEVGEA